MSKMVKLLIVAAAVAMITMPRVVFAVSEIELGNPVTTSYKIVVSPDNPQDQDKQPTEPWDATNPYETYSIKKAFTVHDGALYRPFTLFITWNYYVDNRTDGTGNYTEQQKEAVTNQIYPLEGPKGRDRVIEKSNAAGAGAPSFPTWVEAAKVTVDDVRAGWRTTRYTSSPRPNVVFDKKYDAIPPQPTKKVVIEPGTGGWKRGPFIRKLSK